MAGAPNKRKVRGTLAGTMPRIKGSLTGGPVESVTKPCIGTMAGTLPGLTGAFTNPTGEGDDIFLLIY